MAKTITPEKLSWTIFSLTVAAAVAFIAAVGLLVLM
jgi:hypothetical protein